MPQVLAIVSSPYWEELVRARVMDEVSARLIGITEQVFELEGKNDVTFTAIEAVFVTGDAPFQVEVRYTAGEDEYGRGEPFQPSKELRDLLADRIMGFVQKVLNDYVDGVSVWVRPYENTTFKERSWD